MIRNCQYFNKLSTSTTNTTQQHQEYSDSKQQHRLSTHFIRKELIEDVTKTKAR